MVLGSLASPSRSRCRSDSRKPRPPTQHVRMRVQLWSYNYEPEIQGVAPVSAALAEGLMRAGYEVTVVSAHPHYPEPIWGVRLRPYREVRNGIPVLRLPLWPGRGSGKQRIRQELTVTAAQTIASPLLPAFDVLVATTPCFPALAPAMALARVRRRPWIMWVHDIVPDGAAATGLVRSPALLEAAWRFERLACASAAHIAVVSDNCRQNLTDKGIPAAKVSRIYHMNSRQPGPTVPDRFTTTPPTLLALGNVGHSQGLDRIVDVFQSSPSLSALHARLLIAGSGAAAENVRQHIREPDRVLMPGMVTGHELDAVLGSSALGVVSQLPDLKEFNLPSKMMNYMANGLPILAAVRPDSETARLVAESGAGWVTDSARPEEFSTTAAEKLRAPDELQRASDAGRAFAAAQFAPDAVTGRFEDLIDAVTSGRR